MPTDLASLASALAAATGPSLDLDERLALELFGWAIKPGPAHGRRLFVQPGRLGTHLDVPAYTASLDAITAAIEARWPKCLMMVDGSSDPSLSRPHAGLTLATDEDVGVSEIAATPALALCLAAVRLAMGER